MPIYQNEKWACSSCTKGHRSSKCTHTDRILYKVRKPGRPLNNCPHVLPASIPAGTFVNTSAESMANGEPPKEVCGCKNDTVQVAIPKGISHSSSVKSCSCLHPEAGKIIHPRTPSQSTETIEKTIKRSQIDKSSHSHTKKSSIAEKTIDAIREEAKLLDFQQVTHAGLKMESTMTNLVSSAEITVGSNLVQSENDTKPAWEKLIENAGRIPGGSFMPGGYLKRNAGQAFGTPALAASDVYGMQASYPHTLTIGEISSPFDDAGMNQSLATFTGPLSKLQSNPAYSQPMSEPISRKASCHIPMAGDFTPFLDKKHHITIPQVNQSPIKTSSRLMASLSQEEWGIIQQIRKSGIDLFEISKFINERETSSPFNFAIEGTNGSLTSETNSPYRSIEYSNSTSTNASPMVMPESPAAMEGINNGSCCSKRIKSTPAQHTGFMDESTAATDTTANTGCCSKRVNTAPLPPTHFASPQPSSCCASKKSTAPTQPGSPQCHCPADACLCVPCAEHPFNPAMQEHIRQHMHMMQLPANVLDQPGFTSNSPTGYYEAEPEEDSQGLNTFSDAYVFCDYSYGSGCTEGTGGCKCGEGCSCVGCLTHGGHDGVSSGFG